MIWLKLVLLLLLIFNSLHSVSSKYSHFIDDPQVLSLIEERFSWPQWFTDSNLSMNNQELFLNSKNYRQITTSISQDLEKKALEDPLSSITLAKSHRLFNKKWLQSKSAHYELVGIINRVDRRDFHSKKTCGEMRFIYRLSYRIKKRNQIIQSRLPLTFNVVAFLKAETCDSFLKKWKKVSSLKNEKLAHYLLSSDSPLDKNLRHKTLKSIEMNLQAIRWPSTIRPDMGGYAEYFLRVFKPMQNGFALAPLENSPNINLIQNNDALKKQLLNWLLKKEQLKKLDEGTLTLPNKYLSHKATSVALHGRTRKFNKPYNQVFSSSDFKKVDFSSYLSFKTPNALLNRLNDLSCVGCHQGRTVAGFHFLGKDNEKVSPLNAILSSFSPHFMNDQPRREKYFNTLSKNQSPNRYRSLSVRAPQEKGYWGAHCSMGTDSSYENWTCNSGLICKSYDLAPHSPLGTCVEPNRASEGSACRVGVYKSHNHPEKDRLIRQHDVSCRKDLHCEKPSVGFPGGMCSGNCSKLGSSATCGSIAVLFGFNRCLARGNAFEKCLENNVRPGSLRACSPSEPCRDDYVCAKTNNGSGGCIPPYFLFQLRVDGHPKPL